MSYHKVPYREKGYLRYAALANIEMTLEDARANLRRAQREAAWFEELAAVRAEQDRSGEWARMANAEDAEEYWDGVWRNVERGAAGRSTAGFESMPDLRAPGDGCPPQSHPGDGWARVG